MRIGRFLLIGLASVLALVVADATAATARLVSATIVGRNPPTASALVSSLTILIATTLVAGAVYAAFVVARGLPRRLLVVVGLVPVGLLIALVYVDGQTAARVDQPDGTFAQLFAFTLAPTTAGAVLGVAIAVAAITRRPIPTYESPLQTLAARPGGSGGRAVLAVVAAAVVWFASGLAEVCLTGASDNPAFWPLFDFSGHFIGVLTIGFASAPVQLGVAALAVLLAGAGSAFLVSAQMRPWVTLALGLAFVAVPVGLIVASTQRGSFVPGGGLPDGKLLAALEAATITPAVTGSGLLLGVALIIVAVARLREHTARPVPAPSLALDPTIELFSPSAPH